jgi:hypothetical protein
VASITVFAVAGCAGGVTQQSSLPVDGIGSLAHARHVVSASGDCLPSPAGTGMLRDGDFSLAPDPGSWQGIPVGTRFAPDWVVTQRTIDFYGHYGAWPVPGGLCSIDLDGSGPNGVGAIGHAPVATTPGATYTLGFLFSGNRHCAAFQHGPLVKTMTVKAVGSQGTLRHTFRWSTLHDHDAEHGDFATEAWTFQATSDATRILFQSDDQPITSNCGPVVAAVALAEN